MCVCVYLDRRFARRRHFTTSQVGAPLALCLLTACMLWPALARGQRRGWLARLPTSAAVRALENGDTAAREQAARRLGYAGAQETSVDALIAALATERDPSVRSAILESLARRADPSTLEALDAALTSGSPSERRWAANALGVLGTADASSALVEALAGRRTREAAAEGLARAGAHAIPPLLTALQTGGARIEAARVLAAWSAEGPRAELARDGLRRAARA
ncbi:MAG: HEAT repeat domain-containing protein, partial [Deltaproteobacteria bacterium]|nr:HEAT repeat domain-containing protein [Deltaproteobacteria bacterium]